MTQIELLTQRWNCIQEARLKEMQEIAKKDIRKHMSLVDLGPDVSTHITAIYDLREDDGVTTSYDLI